MRGLNDKNILHDLITAGEFIKAYPYTLNLSFKELETILISICDDESTEFSSNTLAVYFFMQYSNSVNETAQKHNFMTDLTFMYPEQFLVSDGCIVIGMNHMKRACELDPTNIQYKEWLLMFYDHVPGDAGEYLTKSEYDTIKQQIADLKRSDS